jgi:hypothetical protein
MKRKVNINFVISHPPKNDFQRCIFLKNVILQHKFQVPDTSEECITTVFILLVARKQKYKCGAAW